MVSTCPRTVMKLPAGQVRAVGLDDPGDVAAHRAEVPVLHRAVDVHHPPGVVVGDHRHLAPALDGGHVAEDLRAARSGRAAERNVLEILERLDEYCGAWVTRL